MRPHQRSSGLAIAGLVMAGLSVFTNLMVCWLMSATMPESHTHSGPTGGFDIALLIAFKLAVLLIGGLIGLVCTVLTVVYGAIGAFRTGIPWQRVSCWVSIASAVVVQALAFTAGVFGLIAATRRR